MSEERSGFPWVLVFVLLSIVLVIGAFSAFPVLRIFPVMFFSVHQIKSQEAKMQRPEVYSQVGHLLAVYCQSGAAIFPTGFVGNAWLPKPVRELHPSAAGITETSGGFGSKTAFDVCHSRLRENFGIQLCGKCPWRIRPVI